MPVKKKRFARMAEVAILIFSSDASWDTKYNLIFSKAIAGEIGCTGILPDWKPSGLDTQGEVRTYVAALLARMVELDLDSADRLQALADMDDDD